MANTGFKGLDVRQTANELVFRTLLQSSTGTLVTSGTTNLYLYEIQSDGTLSSYDWSSNTFKTTALTTETQAMTHRTGNNSTTNTGIWTYSLSTLTGFTNGAVYLARTNNTSASPADSYREFQFGSDQGDLVLSGNFLEVDVEQWKTGTVPATSQTGVPVTDPHYWNGTAFVSTATAGIPDVNVKNYNNQTAQTDANNLPKVDLEDIKGTVSAGTAGYIGPDWGHVNAPTTTVGLTGTTIATSQVVASVTGAVGSVTGAVGSVTGNVGGNVTGSVGSVVAIVSANVTQWSGTAVAGSVPPDTVFIRTGTAQAGGASTITLDAGASATNNFYSNEIIQIRSGTGAGQSGIVSSYVGSTKVATMTTAWATAPDNTSVFTILPFGSISATVSGTVTVGGYTAGQDPATYVLGTPANKLTTDSSGRVDVGNWLGHAVTVDTNNLPNINVKDYNGSVVSAQPYTGTPPTTAAIATAIFTDTTASDFTTNNSPGKILVTQLGGAFTTTSSSVYTSTSLANAPTGGTAPTVAQIATGVWQDLTSSSDFTTNGSIGKLLAALLFDGSGYVKANAETVSDKTGYSLTQSFPANFAAMAITAGGAITVGTNNDKTGYALSSAGLDSIVVETGLNARQSLSIIASAVAGVLAGAATTTVTIAGAGVPATGRITATVDSSGDRSAVTLSPPA